MIAVLRRRGFALLWTAGLVSLLGDSVLSVAIPFYVYLRTGSAAATGALVAAETLPQVVLGSLAGVFADRWDRRRTMVVCDLTRAGLLLLLLLTSWDTWFWLDFPVAFLHAAVGQVFFPARNAWLVQLVDGDRLVA